MKGNTEWPRNMDKLITCAKFDGSRKRVENEADIVDREQLPSTHCKYSLRFLPGVGRSVFRIYIHHMVVVQRKGGRCRQGMNPRYRKRTRKATSGCWQAVAAVRAPSLSTVHPFRPLLHSRSRDIMEAVFKVARTTRYRNTTGAPGVSRERSAGLCVLL